MDEYSRIVYDQSRKKIRIITLEGLPGLGKSTHNYQLDKMLGERCVKNKLKYNKDILKRPVSEIGIALREYTKQLERKIKEDDHEIFLLEGGVSSAIITCLSRNTHSLVELEKIFFDATSKITEIHTKYGYLELILIPEHINVVKERFDGKEISNEELIKQQELIQGFQLFKDTKWGRCFDSEIVEIKKDETILNINDKIKKILNQYNLVP